MGPGEAELDRWSVNYSAPGQRLIAGKIIATNRRVMFDPQTYAGGAISALLSLFGRTEFKRRHSLIVDKTQILYAGIESGILGKRLVLQLADGRRVEFDRGVIMGVDDLLTAVQQR